MEPRECMGFPPEDYMAAEDGLPENLLYADVRWLSEPGRFEAMWEHEERVLAHGGDPEGEAARRHFQDDESFCMGFDSFVGSTIIALAGVGAVPYSSCNGAHGHSESHPLVVFWCGGAQLSIIEAAALESGVLLTGVAGDWPSVMVWVEKDATRLREFARVLRVTAARRYARA